MQTAKDAMDRLCRDYPAMVNNAYNQGELSAYVVERQLLPTWQTVRGAYLELATTGKLMLVPSRVGIHRLGGDALVGAYQVGQLNADELKKLTTPFRSLSEREQIDKMSADQYYRSEHGRALREERNRTADNVIRERQFLGGEAAVDFFLAANRDYVRSDKNRRAMLDWIGKHANGLMNKNTMQEAFDALKDQLELSPENNAEYGSTRVIDYSDLNNHNPMHYRPLRTNVELVEQKIVKKLTMADARRLSAEQFAVALKDTELGPQIEALLANQ